MDFLHVKKRLVSLENNLLIKQVSSVADNIK